MAQESTQRVRATRIEETIKRAVKSAYKRPTKRVYICSPLKGNIERNMRNAVIFCRFAFDKGYVPIAPHIYFPQFLQEDNRNEREAGLRYGLEMMWLVRELWVFGEYISEGMMAEIQLAKQLKIKIRYFDIDMKEM